MGSFEKAIPKPTVVRSLEVAAANVGSSEITTFKRCAEHRLVEAAASVDSFVTQTCKQRVERGLPDCLSRRGNRKEGASKLLIQEGDEMPKFVSKKQLDSVEYLTDIHKAGFLMRSLTNSGEYRFGGIGVSEKGQNSGIKRLAQCSFSEYGKIKGKWAYIAMMEYDKKTSPTKIRALEKLVRDDLFKKDGLYLGSRDGGRDRIFGVKDEAKLIRDFKKSLK